MIQEIHSFQEIIDSYLFDKLLFIFPEDESLGEADSFVGQSPPPPGGTQPGAPPSSTMFQTPSSTSQHDPFAQIRQGSPARPPVGLPPHSASPGGSLSPLAPTTKVPASGASMSSVPPMPNASGKLWF